MRMHLSLFLVLLSILNIGQQIASGASTTPVPATTAAPATSPVPATTSAATSPPPALGANETVPTDIGFAPGAPVAGACSEKNPCPDPNSQCIDGNCICNEGFFPVGNDTCFKSPGLGEPCRIGTVEVSCTGYAVDISCPQNGTAVCQCKPGYEPGKNSTCKPAKRNVGAECKIDGDCTAAFTYCESGKCACIDAFEPDKKSGLCTPTVFKCFNSDKPLEEKGKVKLCTFKVNSTTGDVQSDTCPSTHMCYQWQNSQTADGGIPGHCCPKPTPSPNNTANCAVGSEHTTGKCIDFTTFPADQPLPDDIGPLCPLGGGYECSHGRTCCPLACRSSNSHFNVDGHCYDYAILDEPCEVDAQCFGGSFAACIKGTCQCKPEYKRDSLTLCLAPGQPSPFAPVP